jgi:hypothetical protein
MNISKRTSEYIQLCRNTKNQSPQTRSWRVVKDVSIVQHQSQILCNNLLEVSNIMCIGNDTITGSRKDVGWDAMTYHDIDNNEPLAMSNLKVIALVIGGACKDALRDIYGTMFNEMLCNMINTQYTFVLTSEEMAHINETVTGLTLVKVSENIIGVSDEVGWIESQVDRLELSVAPATNMLQKNCMLMTLISAGMNHYVLSNS